MQHVTILAATLACSAAAIVVASRLTRGYIQTLERSLMNRALELDLSDANDLTTRTTMLRTITRSRTLGDRQEGEFHVGNRRQFLNDALKR